MFKLIRMQNCLIKNNIPKRIKILIVTMKMNIIVKLAIMKN